MGLIERLKRDIVYIDGLARSLYAYRDLKVTGTNTVADDLETSVDKHGDNVAFRFEGEAITYRQFEARANTFAHWALAQELKPGDTVALLMGNKPDYVACWFGLSKIGVIAALINTNLVGAPLAHCLNISNAAHIVVDADLVDAVRAIAAQLTSAPKLWEEGGELDSTLAAMSTTRPPASSRAGVRSDSSALLVYTSGTTGAPKAARITHLRAMRFLRAFVGGGHARASDRVYVTLPLYHATGGLTGVGFALESGGAVILRRKFSASHFWDDVQAEQATVFFYIGELCRYLLNAPPHPHERDHQLRLGVGNGLRPEVWEKFQARFAIAKILEFYGSTEGNVSIVNFDGKAGAVGRIPNWLRGLMNVRLVKYDVENDAPVRGPDGLAVEAGVDEPGEGLGEIRQDKAQFKFEGYSSDPKQTEKKIMRDVFAKGDAWFRTGDLMRKDADGYFYFIDRIGDTFRWKGENVSTNEVGDVIAAAPGVAEANVYGVKIGDLDGRAGMAAITTGEGFDLAPLRGVIVRDLPPYARPLFIRLQPAIETTGTFKYRKIDLVAEGFDPEKTADPIYFDDAGAGAYTPMTPALYRDIQSGQRRL